jgi:ubiquinone/menaquinone biosynthesis C-methylase UbiE
MRVSDSMKNKSKPVLPNDGERMVPEFDKNTIAYGDHIARYLSVLDLVEGKTVLDIASGSGYGTQLLAQSAKHVFGVDINEKAVVYARNFFNSTNITYKVGSGTKIPLENSSVDYAITFETIEHIIEADKFISELKRVLKPKGQLILSTPNDKEFPKGNHFHVHQYEYLELLNLLKKHFQYTDPYFQATWLYSGVSAAPMVFEEKEENIKIINGSPLKPEQVLFFLLLCSNEPIKNSIKSVGVLAEHWSSKNVIAHNKKVEKYIKNTIKHFEGILIAKDKQISELNKAINNNKVRKLIKKIPLIKNINHQNN